MSEVRPDQERRPARGIFRASLLCAVAWGALHAGIAQAQQTALRGEVSEKAVTDDLLSTTSLIDRKTPLDPTPPDDPNTTADNGIPAPDYKPASDGATPEEDADLTTKKPKSIFADDSEDGADNPAIGRPKTAAARAAARKKANDPQESAAKRLADAKKKPAATAAEDDTATADTTGTVRTKTVDSEDVLKTKKDSERTGAIEGLEKTPDTNPYAPVGIRLGSFLVTTTAESGVTWTSNANSSTNGSPATLSETTLRLNAISDYGGDKTTFDAFGNFRKTISGEEIKETRAGVDAALERELADDWRALASLGYEVGPESASSPVAVTGTLDQPIKHSFTGSVGIEKAVGKLRLRLTGNVEREIYGDAELSTGGSVSQADRDTTLGTVVLRTGYEVSPALVPFVELEYGRRFYDQDPDSNGFDRASTRMGVRGGMAFDFGEKLSGEVSAGWINEDLKDARLASISGPSLAGNVRWSPIRGTNVDLSAETTVEGATSANESGSLLHAGKLTLSHELLANLTAEATLGAALRDYTGQDGEDHIYSAEASMTWWLNRYVGVTGKARTERQDSTLPGRDYTANSVFLGLKLQR